MVTRPQFYGLLQRHMPKEYVHVGKKIASMDQSDEGVVLRFTDGTEARGDILIGADGAYSAVREALYAKLKEANKLPPSDALPLPFSTICLVGQTLPITTKEFPDLKHSQCLFRRIIGTDKMYSVSQKKGHRGKKC
jgi:2-polyprenyl-6-methoxyphenol hydroxylase-like FAD-dependent oxidoreductase